MVNKDFLYKTGLPNKLYDARKMSNFLAKSGRKKIFSLSPKLFEFLTDALDNYAFEYKNPKLYPLLSKAFDNTIAIFLPRILQKHAGFMVKFTEAIMHEIKKMNIRRKA